MKTFVSMMMAALIGFLFTAVCIRWAEAAEVPKPEPSQIVGGMLLPATAQEQVIAVLTPEPIKLARGIMPESNNNQLEKSAYIADNPEDAEHETVASQVNEPQMTYLGSFKITGYDICVKCCGNTKGITASGTTATVGRTCAAPAGIPFGTRLYIEGIGERVVEDRGGAVKGNKIDVLCEDHPACYAITGTYEVYIVEG